MNKDTEKTKVIFRCLDDGEVVAVFPGFAGDMNPYRTCTAYLHIGQHTTCNVSVFKWTRPAKPEEYKALADELEYLGYNLQIAKRFTRKDLDARKEQCKL